MQNIIGLGQAGVNIARGFAEYPQYGIYTLDSESNEMPNHLLLNKCETHEAYERSVPSLSEYFKDIPDDEDVLFIVGGGGAISGASLAILEQLRRCKVRLLYIRPDTSLLSQKKCMQDRVTYNILQQYARSANFERIILIDNAELDKVVGGAPVIGYYEALNKILISALHMINVFDHSKPIMSTLAKPLEVSRITTVGLLDIEKNEEKLLFPLTAVREKSYYYAVNNETLKTDTTLFKTITDQMKEKIIEDKLKISYGIYSTQYKQKYGFLLARSSMVQGVLEETKEE